MRLAAFTTPFAEIISRGTINRLRCHWGQFSIIYFGQGARDIMAAGCIPMIQLMDCDTSMKIQASLPFGERNGEKGHEKKEPEAVMVYEEEFGRLEQFVEKLIKSYNDLKAENSSLRQQLTEMEQQNQQNKDFVTSLQNDRSIMHARVTQLIMKIDEWEKSHRAAAVSQDTLSGKKTGGKKTVPPDPTFSSAVE